MKYKETEKKHKGVICKKEFYGYGNNAEPIKKGLCCNTMNQKILLELQKIASRGDTVNYSQLAADCDIPYTSIDERNKFHALLGKISTELVKESKPMLSVLVHHKGDLERTPGAGFFKLADALNQRKKGESDKQMHYRILKECWNYQNEAK